MMKSERGVPPICAHRPDTAETASDRLTVQPTGCSLGHLLSESFLKC